MPKGGKRPGAGRKSKAEELGLTEMMDAIGPSEKVLKAIWELATGPHKNIEALKLWMSYKFGKPKESVKVEQDTVITWIEEDGDTNPETA
jgi:hypothetical protein